MRLLRLLRTGIGLVGFAVLVAVTVAPELFAFPGLALDLSEIDPGTLRLGAAVLIGLSVLWTVVSNGGDSNAEALPALVTDPPEEIHGRATRRAGAPLDAAFDALTEGDDEEAERFERDLRSSAIALYAAVAACSATEARQAVDEGRWTDDPRAAAFLGTEVDPLPLRTRVWDVVRPGHPLEHRVRHTVEALEALDAGGDSR